MVAARVISASSALSKQEGVFDVHCLREPPIGYFSYLFPVDEDQETEESDFVWKDLEADELLSGDSDMRAELVPARYIPSKLTAFEDMPATVSMRSFIRLVSMESGSDSEDSEVDEWQPELCRSSIPASMTMVEAIRCTSVHGEQAKSQRESHSPSTLSRSSPSSSPTLWQLLAKVAQRICGDSGAPGPTICGQACHGSRWGREGFREDYSVRRDMQIASSTSPRALAKRQAQDYATRVEISRMCSRSSAHQLMEFEQQPSTMTMAEFLQLAAEQRGSDCSLPTGLGSQRRCSLPARMNFEEVFRAPPRVDTVDMKAIDHPFCPGRRLSSDSTSSSCTDECSEPWSSSHDDMLLSAILEEERAQLPSLLGCLTNCSTDSCSMTTAGCASERQHTVPNACQSTQPTLLTAFGV